MNIENILKLVDAGFGADEIKALVKAETDTAPDNSESSEQPVSEDKKPAEEPSEFQAFLTGELKKLNDRISALSIGSAEMDSKGDSDPITEFAKYIVEGSK